MGLREVRKGRQASSDAAPREASRLLAGLTATQRQAVMTDHQPLCVLAGAGSGKTTVLTRRVARRVLEGSATPEHVMVATFTRKAASEVRTRIARLGVAGDVWAGTFHAAAYLQLRRLWASRGERPARLLDDPVVLLRRMLPGGQAFNGRQRPFGATTEGPSPELMKKLAGEIHWAKARLVAPCDYPAAARASRRVTSDEEFIAETYAHYEQEKKRRGLMDLDDLLDRCSTVMEEDMEEARAQRWRLRHFFVDEFQDLNPAQWRLLRAWLGERDDLFVVGDPRQAVYGWNGADPTFIERFSELVPGAEVVRLGENHRSSSQIVSVANSLLEVDGLSSPNEPPHASTAATSLCFREGPAPLIASFQSEEAEALEVTRWLRRAHRPGRAWSQLAVIARTNARLQPVERALCRAGIPHRVASAPFTDRVITDALGFLRSLDPVLPLRSAYADLVTFVQSTTETSAAPFVSDDGVSPPSRPPDEVSTLVDEYSIEEPGATVGAFLAWLCATTSGEAMQCSSSDRVEITTFHKAKGLEWAAVAVIGLEEGVVPISYAATAEALDEERRLLYVALTRAEEELWCSRATERRHSGRSRATAASPFLEPVARAAASLASRCDVETSRGHLADMRSRLGASA